MASAAFSVKAEIRDPQAEVFAFLRQKTMYGGKSIAAGDMIYLFASEKGGGRGLIARGVVVSSERVARQPGTERQTPRVNLSIRRTALA